MLTIKSSLQSLFSNIQQALYPQLLLAASMASLTLSCPLFSKESIDECCKRCEISLSDPWIEVDSSNQTLYLRSKKEKEKCIKTYTISTAKKGLGQKSGSFQTPTGLHVVCKKVGKNCPLYSVFVGRALTKEICRPGQKLGNKDPVTTRILVLDGLEKGLNRGSDAQGTLVDSYKRYIYIHGTPEEHLLGTQASRGCVRMSGADILVLFDLVKEGTVVWIH